ncbi:1,3-beta-glucanosyltransferase [Mycena venus]|uniref:1,3-beta-glucanosyltransferase n=1 Tax=Mycena venus TaxID=2733690 RepID=A0A8H6X6S1_9AGAR|nr:1,3-beta-glucanosyltransferase [Mycena venus]
MYGALNAESQNYNIVAYFSKFGLENCNPGTRPWTEVGTLFASPMTNVWSGGLVFSYFSAQSQGHEFGMVTLSSDNTTVTTNADFANLVSQYDQVNFANINSPSQSCVAARTFGVCPSEGASLEASAMLPPTPNDQGCGCVASKLGCSFKLPTNGDYTAILGTLTGVVCGTTGMYGDEI